MVSKKSLPLTVVSIIRYPAKHDSASQESLLSLFGPPSLLANDKYFTNIFLPKIRGRQVRPPGSATAYRQHSFTSFTSIKHIREIPTGSLPPPAVAPNTGGV